MDGRKFFILGPTASGKHRLAVEIARIAGGEVISVDSMKVYRGLDIGTAKPGPEARAEVRFHLIDIRDPHEPMSVAEFVREALAAEADIRRRGRLPVFEGGTALYVRAITEGIFEGPSADAALRERLLEVAREEGNEALHARLAAVDPVAAKKLHPNDLRRVIRALEVFEKTGRPISELQTQWGPERRDRVLIGLRWEREPLNARIDARVDRMFDEGFVEEARALLARPQGVGREADQALGYRQLFQWIREGADPAQLPAVREKIKRATRLFARRQHTFLRHFPDIVWHDVNSQTDPNVLALKVLKETKVT